MLIKCYSFLNRAFLPLPSLHKSYTEMHSYHFSTGGFPWQAQHRQLVAQSQHREGHLQETGRRDFSRPGREPSMIIAASSFPFLRGEDRCSQLRKCPKPQHTNQLVCFRPSKRNHAASGPCPQLEQHRQPVHLTGTTSILLPALVLTATRHRLS